MSVSFSLLHQRALIIGGTSGIGLSIAQAMLSAGARVAVIGRNREKLASAVRTLSGERQDIVGLQADVSDDTQLKTVITPRPVRSGRVRWFLP